MKDIVGDTWRALRDVGEWLVKWGVRGVLVLVCWLLFFNDRGANPPAPRPSVYERMVESARRCQNGNALSCVVLKLLAEEYVYGSNAERCLYGDGDYEACQDAAYELAEEKGLAW